MSTATIVRNTLWLGVVLAGTIAIPALFSGSSYAQYMIEIIGIYMLATTGLNVAIGFAGQFQMAQGAIMGVTAYGVAIFTADFGYSLGLAAIFGLVVGMILGGIVSLLSARLSSHYLLLATFAVQVIVVNLIREFSGLTGGVNGRAALATFDIGGWQLVGSTPSYSALIIAVAGLGLFASDWLKRSYFGLGIQSVRQNPRVTTASGLFANRFKFAAVLLSAAYAAVAGVLVGPVHTFLVPDSFGIEITLLLLVIVVVGGAGSVVGVALATVVLAIASQIAQSATTAWPLIYGLFVMAVLALTNEGLAGLTNRLRIFRNLIPAVRPGPLAAGATVGSSVDLAASPARTGRNRVCGRRTAASDGAPVLDVEKVYRSFGGVTALNGISVHVLEGTVHGLVGPNGSGKTTLFEAISGFVRLDRGNISAFGRNITSLNAVERALLGIGRSFQHPNVLNESSVLDNVLLGVLASVPVRNRFSVLAIDRDQDWRRRAFEALELVGLTLRRQERASELPYGQRKLLDIARVVAARPRLVLLDEPVAGVDAKSANYVRQVVEFLREQKSTVVLVEHNMRFVMELSDRVTVLNTGQVLASGSPQEVASNDTVIHTYLGAEVAGA